jgi:predicted XRE-type DNA-binding protein
MSETDKLSEADHEITFLKSSGNVFADLGLPHPDERMAKAQLALAITRRIRARGLNQTEAAALLGTDQGKVSQLMRGRLTSFSYDRLLRFLNVLGCNVQIMVELATSQNEQGQTVAIIAA